LYLLYVIKVSNEAYTDRRTW